MVHHLALGMVRGDALFELADRHKVLAMGCIPDFLPIIAKFGKYIRPILLLRYFLVSM